MSPSSVRIELFPSHDMLNRCVDLRVQIPMELWAPVTGLAGIQTTPTQGQLLAALQAVLVMGGHGAERLASRTASSLKADDLAKEVLSWKDLDVVPLGRLVRAIIAAGEVVGDARG